MRAKVEKGDLCININAVLEALSLEDKISIMDRLSCDDEVIAHVTSQLLDGYTENGSCGYTRGGRAEPFTPLDKARREIALRSGEVAKKEIEDLCHSLRWVKACEKKYRDWGFAMYHGGERNMPPSIEYDEI